MTWKLARRQLVTMIEGIPSSSLDSPKVFGERFNHEPSLFVVTTTGRKRDFALRGVGAGAVAVATAASSRRTQQDVDLVVEYPIHKEDDKLDEIIWSDWRVLVDRILDVREWGRPASTIEAVTLGRVDLNSITEDIDGDDKIIGRRLTIQFTLSHTEQTL